MTDDEHRLAVWLASRHRKVTITSGGCWVLLPRRSDASAAPRKPSIHTGGEKWLAARFVVAMLDGFICGPVVRHLCHEERCIRPIHLRPGTQKENYQDEVTAGKHMHGQRHWATKLRDEDIPEIRAALRSGEAPGVIGRRYGVSRTAIRAIRRGKTWIHIPELLPDVSEAAS